MYGLAERGARYLKDAVGVAVSGADWQARNRSYTRENLDHTLAVSRYLIDVMLACRARADVAFIPFEEIAASAPPSKRPGRWPVSLAWQGARAEVHLVPDAIFGLRRIGEDGKPTSSYFFVEVDRGTMTIAPAQRVQESDAFLYRATVLRKLIAYAESWRQELHRAHLGIHAPRVLFLTTSRMRADSMRAAAEKYVVGPQGLLPGMYLFGSVAEGVDPLRAPLMDATGRQVSLV